MSSGARRTLAGARAVVERFLVHLDGLCESVLVAGSIRRERETVGDAEIVVLPHRLDGLWTRLDTLLASGVIAQADYGAGAVRWGMVYRGLVYQGMKIEVFTCDMNNRGYQQWLRTGPADKNAYVMTRLKQHRSVIRMSGGYVWHVSYDKAHPAYKADPGYAKLGKLIVSDEWVLYWLLGMDPIAPRERTDKAYRQYLERWVYTPPVEEIEALYMPEPKQLSLF